MASRRSWGAAAMGALVASMGCAAPQRPAATSTASLASAPVGTPLVLSLERIDGTTLDLTRFRGRAMLIIAFRMDHLASQATLRNAERLARAHVDDLTVVAITGDSHPYRRHRTLAEVFASVLELRATHVLLADPALREGHSSLGPIAHVPTTFLINRAGRIVRGVQGFLTYEQLAALVAPALPPQRTAAP